MAIVAKIGLTGGPGGGKTHFSSYSRQALMDRGFRPVYFSEVATLFNTFGIGPTSQVLKNLEYQYMVAKYQLSTENILIESLEKSRDKIILIFDRTVLDSKAYCTEEEWGIILERLQITEADIYERYDLIIHFVTTAIGKYSSYSTDNNPARSESKDQAIGMETKNTNAFNGVPISKRICLSNDVTFEEKQSMALNVVLGYLGLAEPIFGKQQKFLVWKIPTRDLYGSFSPNVFHISQTYLNLRNDEVERRIRCISNENEKAYYYTQKDKNQKLCYDKKISYEVYMSFMNDKILQSNVIEKDRYSFSHNNLYFQYDVFAFWKDFAILEVQPTNVQKEVVIPAEFDVINEITDVTSLLNRSLAKNIVTEQGIRQVFKL